MSDAARIIRQARKAGLALNRAQGQRLELAGPADAVERLRPTLAEHKAAILATHAGMVERASRRLAKDANDS